MRLYRLSASIAMFLGILAPAYAQIVQFDWAARSLQSFPTNITQTTFAQVKVHNINDIVGYSYTVVSSCAPNQATPFETIAGLLPTGTPQSNKALGDPCPTAVDSANAALSSAAQKINEMKTAPAPNGSANCTASSPCDISLATTQAFFDQNVAGLINTASSAVIAAQNACASNPSALQDINSKYNQILASRDQVKSPTHDFLTTVTLLPDSTCTLTITQRYAGVQTQNGSAVATFSPGQPRMTLSAGPLFSEIQNRSYSVVTVPPTGSGTMNQNVLQINGNSTLTTYLAALLNFHFPSSKDWINGENYGAALSTGPVLRLGGESSASAFGWFTGLSYYINHLVYISAGVHVGQFAGNPAGFSEAGQVVPANFPTPVAQNRTTARFAFAVTLRAKDFSTLSKGTSAPGTGSPPAPNTPPQPNSNPQPQPGNPQPQSSNPQPHPSNLSAQPKSVASLSVPDSSPTMTSTGTSLRSSSDSALQVSPSDLNFGAFKAGVAPTALMLVLTDTSGSRLNIRARITSAAFSVDKVECDGYECFVVVRVVAPLNSNETATLKLIDETGRFVEVPLATQRTK